MIDSECNYEKMVISFNIIHCSPRFRRCGVIFLGRYTNIPTWVMIAFIIVMGLGVGAFVRQKHVRRFLGH